MKENLGEYSEGILLKIINYIILIDTINYGLRGSEYRFEYCSGASNIITTKKK